MSMTALRMPARDDSGMALAIVISAIALLVLLLTAAFYASSQTLFQSRMADQHDAAFQAASSGVLVAFTELQGRTDDPPAEVSWDGDMPDETARYEVEATLNEAHDTYSCTSTGIAPDGTREVVVATFRVSRGRASSLPWGNNVFYFADYNGGTIVGNGTINGPFYIIFPPRSTVPTFTLNSAAAEVNGGPLSVQNGDISIKTPPAAPIDVYSNGRLAGNAAGSPNLVFRGWDPAKALPVTRVAVSAYLDKSRADAVAQSSDNKMGELTKTNYEAVAVGDPGTYTSVALNPPNGRPAGWTRTKAPGAAAAYKVIGSSLTIDWQTPSFGSWSGDGHYPTEADLHDDFAYDAASHTLYVEGTVFVDGDLTINQSIRYVGNGVIVCTGNINVNATVEPDRPAGADGVPDPDARHLLGLFTPRDLTLSTNNIRLVAAAYVVGRLQVPANNDTLKGSFVSELGLGTLSNGTIITAFPALGDFISPGLPYWGSGGGATGGNGIELTSWRRR
jgi:Tfp pilus assembly protein PilX